MNKVNPSIVQLCSSPKEEYPHFENSPTRKATEYGFKNEKDINIAGIDLDGRYPEKDYSLNEICRVFFTSMARRAT